MNLTMYLNKPIEVFFWEKIETTITQLEYDQTADWQLANSWLNSLKQLTKTFVNSERY